MKLREGNVFSRVHQFVQEGGPMYPLPTITRTHHTLTLVQLRSHCPGTPLRHVQTCWLWSMYGWRADGWHPTGMFSSFKIFLEDINPFGLLVKSFLGFKVRMIPCLCTLSPACIGFFRITSGATPADSLHYYGAFSFFILFEAFLGLELGISFLAQMLQKTLGPIQEIRYYNQNLWSTNFDVKVK